MSLDPSLAVLSRFLRRRDLLFEDKQPRFIFFPMKWTPPETGVAARFMIRLSLRMEGG